ncbi:MAG TPA: peptidoglycan-binding protein [Caulobacteraceae bacterium]|jgi:localization factor PodJL
MAEDLARRSGLSLNEWVSQLMAEGPEDATSQEFFGQPAPAYAEPQRQHVAPRYEVANPRDGGPRYDAARYEPPRDEEVGRVTAALERLSDRIENAESRQALAIAGVERSVREVIARIDAGEREQMQTGARLDGEVQEVKVEAERLAEQVKGDTHSLSERLRKVEDEAAGPRSTEALRALEGAIGKVAGHVYEGEKRHRESLDELRGRVARLDGAENATLSAMRELKTTCGALDARLRRAETEGDGVAGIAESLAARVDAVRAELGQQLAAAADARFDRVEQALAQMTEHVDAAERRSAGALERMGREVLDVAQTLNRRVQSAERGSAEVADRVGADLARIASVVEDRLLRADSVQAQALEKLGGEIARITERLADRIANAERRSAQAIDDVGEQVARVTERIGQRQDRSITELADRIRQSEERTAQLLESARQKLDDRMADNQRRTEEQVRTAASPFDRDDDDDGFGAAPFPAFNTPPPERDFAAGEPAAPTFSAPMPAASAFSAPPPAAPRAPAFEEDDFAAAATFPSTLPAAPRDVADAQSPRHDPFESATLEPNVGFDMDEHVLAPPTAEQITAASAPPTAMTTREVIDRARAAARAATDKAAPKRSGPEEGVLESLSFGRAKRRDGGMSGPLMVASALAAVGLAAGGYMFYEGQPGGALPKRVADALAIEHDGQPADAGANGAPLAAVALAPKPNLQPAGPDLSGPYSAAVAKITAGEKGGLADLTKLANGGYAPAQFYLSQLYQDGKAGLKKDAAQARGWLERAAEGGDRTAMHNLALDEHDGVGGPKNVAAAAEWFRRAAELGLLDSQFNLAAIYEHGDGVGQNLAEAYKWYLIAGHAGDAEAKAGAARVAASLTPDAKAVAESAAAQFQPSPPDTGVALAAAAPAAASSPDLVTAQRALNQLGYYQGPTDGVGSPALKLALAAYQRDQGLPVSGAPDAATIGKLAVYTQ